MISPSQRPLPDNTQHSQHTNIQALSEIRTHNLSRRAAEDLRLRPRGYWDRQCYILHSDKVKVIARQAEVAHGVPGRLKLRIFLTFRHYNGGRSSAAFIPGEIPGTHFQRLSRPQDTWFCRGYHGKKSPVTPPGIDPGTVRLVAQRLNHYAIPGIT